MNRKQLWRIASLFVIIVCALSITAGGGGVRWLTIRVDAGTTFRQVTNSSLKLHGGVPSVAYGSDHLYYATQVDDAFVTTIVDSNWGVGMYASLVLEPATGHPRISYSDGTNDALKYAEMNAVGLSHSWTITTVDLNHTDPSGNKTAIALDSANLPHIAYTKLDGHVWHAWQTCAGCPWNKEEVDSSISANGTNIALVVDSNDFIHIVYSDTSQVLHYAISDGTWEYEKFTSPGGASIYGEEPSLALTTGTWPAIAYVDGTAIKYAWKTGPYPDDWSISTVYYEASTPYSPSSPSLQLPNDDLTQPWISFVDGNSVVRLAVFEDMDPTCPGTDGDFNCDQIAHSAFFRDLSSLAVDTSNPSYNLGRVITIDSRSGELRYNQEDSPDVWTHMPVDFSSNAGLYSSLAVDNTGPHIGYYDRDATIFKYAELDDAEPGDCGEYGSNLFRCDNAADGTKIGSNVATGIGYNNYPHLAYYDRAYPALHYATLNPTWSSILIDGDFTTNDIGRYASLAYSPTTGYARIAYMDVSLGYLKYAQELPSPYSGGNCGPGNTWRCDNVEYTTAQGFGISLAIASNGAALISFVDGQDNLVKVARFPALGATFCTNTAWSCESIAVGHDTQFGQTSIWADSAAGIIHVSFHDSDATTLMLATFNLGGGWAHEVVDQAMYSGTNNSITVVGAMPVIAYSSERWNDLMLASKVGGGYGNCGDGLNWYCQVLDEAGSVGFFPSIKHDPSGRLYISYYDWTNGDLKLTYQALPSFIPLVKKP